MSLWKIAWRSIQQRALSSWLTGLSMALGVALVALVLVMFSLVSQRFTEGAEGCHLIVGKKGSALDLIFSTVYHVGDPLQPIPYNFYKEFTRYPGPDGKPINGKYVEEITPKDTPPAAKKFNIKVAVPYCLGDSYGDSRVVATTPDMFTELTYGAFKDGTPKKYRCSDGDFFGDDDERGAVVGYIAAQQPGLAVGQQFKITHNVPEAGEEKHEHEEKFTVRGILAPTGTPNDFAIFVNIKGFYELEHHTGLRKGIEPYELESDRKAGLLCRDIADHRPTLIVIPKEISIGTTIFFRRAVLERAIG